MQPSFEEYAGALKTFYQKVSRYHSSYIKLNKDFGLMVTQFSKGQNTSIRPKNKNVNRDRDDLSAAGSSHSMQKSHRSDRSRRVLRSTKSQYLFHSPSLGRVFVFAYLYYLIETSNSHNFQMIETKAKFLMETIPKQKINAIDPDPAKCSKIWSKDYLSFKKVMQLLSHKAKVRWERILRETINELQNIFIQIFLRAILNLNASNNFDLNLTPKQLSKISTQLRISICYFECENGEVFNKTEYGEYKYQLKIGFMKADEKYAFFEKMPNDENSNNRSVTPNKGTTSTSQIKNKAVNQSSREVVSSKNIRRDSPSNKSDISASRKKPSNAAYNLTRRKSIRTITMLLSQYNQNTQKMQDLECLKGDISKETKIKRLLENRRKGE